MKFKDAYKDNYEVIYCNNNFHQKTYDNNSNWSYNNGKYYYRGYEVHRESGPAIECKDKYKLWYLNGRQYSEKDYLNIISLKNKNRALDEI